MTGIEDLTIEFYDASNVRHREFADQLEAIRTRDKPAMLPLGAEAMGRHTLGVLVSDGDIAVGYNGIIHDYGDGTAEMGGLLINPDYRGRGLTKHIKAELFAAIRQLNYIKRIVTFANEESLPINLKLGFRPADTSEVPSSSYDLCVDCPRFCAAKASGKLCCDTILTLETEKLPEILPPKLLYGSS